MKQQGFSVFMLNNDQKAKLGELGSKLTGFLPGISFDTLFDMTNRNVLVAAKVLESIFRRVTRLYEFFDKGRVSHPSLNVR